MWKNHLTWAIRAVGGVVIGRVALEGLHKLGADPELWVAATVTNAPDYLQQETALWIMAFAIGGLLFSADYWGRGVYARLRQSEKWVPAASARPGAGRSPAPPAAPSRATAPLSIIVLPFANLSGDPAEDYFADGLTEDVTTDISQHIPGAFVIARNTAYAYKGKAVDVKQLAEQLGVRYVLEGSVQRRDNHLRVNAQLIDGTCGQHLWADRFDGDGANLLELQNDITGRIAAPLRMAMIAAEGRRVEQASGTEPVALDYVTRARALLLRPPNKETLREARTLYERALALDDNSADAWSGVSALLAIEALNFPDADKTDTLRRGEEAAARALMLAPQRADARAARGLVRMAQRRFTEAAGDFEAAVALDRNFCNAYGSLGAVQLFLGRPEQAIPHLEHALRLSPRDTGAGSWQYLIGSAHLYLGHDELALEWLLRARGTNPHYPLTHVFLAAVYGLLGRKAEARASVSEARRLDPILTTEWLRANPYSEEPEYLRLNQRVYEGLLQAEERAPIARS
jgi:adenylate cyclase